MLENQKDLFEQALEESGGQIVQNEGSESTGEQESQTSTEEQSTAEATTTETEQTSSETQGAETGSEATTTEGSEDEGSSQEGEQSEKQSSFVDLNSEAEQSTEEATTEATSETTINFNEMFGEGFNSAEDVIEYATELETRIEELEGQTPEFANEFVEKMNEFVMNGGDPVAFAKIQGMNVDDLSAEEALKLDLQQQYGLTNAEADIRIRDQYSTIDWEEEDGVDPKSINLKIDARAAKDRLKQNQADNTLVEQAPTGISEEELNARQEQSIADAEAEDNYRMWDEKDGWAPAVDEAINSLKDNGVVIDLGNGKGFAYSYKKDDAYTEKLTTMVDQALYDSGLSREENPELAKKITENLFWVENKADILKTFGDEIRSMKTEEYHKISNNPSALKRGDQVSTGERTAVSTEETMTRLWNQ